MIDVLGVGSGGWVLAQRGEVAGRLAVEQRGFAQLGARQLPHAAAGPACASSAASRSQYGRRFSSHWLERMIAMEPIGDQLNIDTPELVAIELPLAGVGSRFIAILIDYLIWGAAFVLLAIIAAIIIPALHFFGGVSANWAAGIFFLIVFLLQWGYFTLFEAFDNGRTPGKRVAKIRVIHQSGRGINFVESLARNLVRFVDYLPGFYAVGVVAMFVSKRNQRLGDMVAGITGRARSRSRRAALEPEQRASAFVVLTGFDATWPTGPLTELGSPRSGSCFLGWTDEFRSVGWAAAPACRASRPGAGQIISRRPRSAGRVLCSAFGHGPHHARCTRQPDRSSPLRQVRPHNSARHQHRDVS